jgi:hypothetical protein
MVYAPTAHNRPVYASPPLAARPPQRLGHSASPIPTPLLRHILSALQMLRICLFGRPKRRKQPERYVQFDLTMLKKLLK